MRLLIVEDEPEVSQALIEAAEARGVVFSKCVVLASRDDALLRLQADHSFDLAVCDLRLPTSVNSLDADPAFGREVYAALREQHPGLPVCIYSAHTDEDFLERLVLDQRQGDPFGAGVHGPMARPFRKVRMMALVEELERVASEVSALEQIDLSTKGIELKLSDDEARVLRIATRRLGGTICRIDPMTSGMSGSRVVMVRVIDTFGGQAAQCVIKIGARKYLEDESARYASYVPGALPAASFAPIFTTFAEGSGDLMGVAYSLGVADPRSLESALTDGSADGATIADRLRSNEHGWISGGHPEQHTVEGICEMLSAGIDPISVIGAMDPGLADRLRGRQIQVLRATQHGDLHLGNVLISQAGDPVFIDYGRTGIKMAAYDPVSLEMCLAFHPAGRAVSRGWPTQDGARAFDDLDAYLEGCTCAGFVRQCREWAFTVASGDREVFAAFLAYAARQLQFSDTDHDLARTFMVRAAERILN